MVVKQIGKDDMLLNICPILMFFEVSKKWWLIATWLFTVIEFFCHLFEQSVLKTAI
jgi:hypothetical protein